MPGPLERRARRLAAAAGRLYREARCRLGPPRALLVYHPDYRAPPNPFADPERAEKILGHLERQGCIGARHLRAPEALPVEALALVHGFEYLERLDTLDVLGRIFASDDPVPDLDGLLRQQRCMTAGTARAARIAVAGGRGGPPVANLGGGFHHAHADHGEAYCVFNDVAVAVAVLRGAGWGGRVLVVDLDLHPGNGTRAIFASDETVFTLSIHAVSWDAAREAVADRHVALGAAIGDRAYREAIERHVPAAFVAARPDLVFYLAGVDVASDDALGSWRVGAETIFWRDALVSRLAGSTPQVWLLAGGYGRNAWRYSARTQAWLLSGLTAPIPSESERAVRRFQRIKAALPPAALTGQEPATLELTDSDVLGDLGATRGLARLLGFYSAHGVEIALARYGVLAALKSRGYGTVRVDLDLRHADQQITRVYADDGRRDLLIELVLAESRAVPPFRLLSIEWLLLQDPRAAPAPERPLLPGQAHPGLGCLSEIVLMLAMACERLDLDGLLFTPAHYHSAAVARGMLAFLDPADEARFLVIEQALEGIPLGPASHMVDAGRVVDAITGAPVSWPTAMMVMPVSSALKARVEGEAFAAAVEESARALRYRIIRSRAPAEPGERGP